MKRRDFIGVSSSAFLVNTFAPTFHALKAAAGPPPPPHQPHWNAGARLSAAHSRIGNRIDPAHLAVGIRLEWLNEYFQNDLALLQSAIKPVSTSLDNLSVKLVVSPHALTVGQDAATKQPTIEGQISLVFMPSDDQTVQFRTRDVKYSKTKLRLISDPVASGEFVLSVDGNAKSSALPASTPPDPALITKYYGGDSNSYQIQETSVLLVGMKALLEQFAQMVPFPQIRRSLKTFRLADPVSVFYDDEYVVVAGQPVLAGKPCTDSNTQFRVTHSGGNQYRVDVDTPPLGNCNSEQPALVDFIYLHPKQTTLYAWASNNIAPSLTASNSGPFLLLGYWSYFVTLSLSSFDVSYVLAPTPAVLFTSSWDVHGTVEGGIQVGCVQERLADLELRGTVGPVVVEIAPCLDGNKLCLQTSVPSGIPNNLDWTLHPLPWPWDHLAGDLLGQIIHGIMPDMGPIVDLFRVCLVDLSGLLNNPVANGSDSDLATTSALSAIQVAQVR